MEFSSIGTPKECLDRIRSFISKNGVAAFIVAIREDPKAWVGCIYQVIQGYIATLIPHDDHDGPVAYGDSADGFCEALADVGAMLDVEQPMGGPLQDMFLQLVVKKLLEIVFEFLEVQLEG